MARRRGRKPQDMTAQNVAQVVEALDGDAEPTERQLGVQSGVRSTVHRNRKALYPWAIAATLTGGGHLAWLIGWGSQQSWPVAGAVGATAVVASGVAARTSLAALPKGWTPWAVAAWLNGLAWLVLTVAYGPSYERAVWLVAATAVFGARWWAQVRRPYPTSGRDPREPVVEAAKPAPVVVVESSITRWNLVDRWDTYLGCKGGPLAGSTVDDPRPIEHGLVTTINLVPGRQSRQSVLQALPLICTALDSYPEDTIIERHPSGPPSMLQLTVVTRPAVAETVFFDRPVYRDGKILLGPYRDGIGNAQVRLYGPDSMYGGFLLGSAGSGKSRALETIALSAMAQRNTVVVYLDGQRGSSSPLLWKHALWRGGPEDVQEIMAGLEGFMRYRQLRLRYEGMRTGKVGFTPSRDYPGIMVIVDECHRIWDKDTVGWWANAAREWRKLGGGIWAATQVVTLKEAFAGSDVLRSSLVSGNGIAFRTVSDVQQNVFPGLRAKLDELPNNGGHGYTIDEGDEGHTRNAPFRARFLVGQAAVDEGQVVPPKGISTADQWFPEVAPHQRLDEQTGQAGGAPFALRLAKAAREQAELERLFAGGEMPDFAGQFALPTTTSREPADAADEPVAKVIRFPRFGETAGQAEDELVDRGPRKPEQLTAAQSRVWDVIAAGKGRPGQIAEVLNVSAAAVHKHLAQMLTDGHIRRAEHGTYEITG